MTVSDSTEVGEEAVYVKPEVDENTTSATGRDDDRSSEHPATKTEPPQKKSPRKGSRLFQGVDYVLCKPTGIILNSAVQEQEQQLQNGSVHCGEQSPRQSGNVFTVCHHLSGSSAQLQTVCKPKFSTDRSSPIVLVENRTQCKELSETTNPPESCPLQEDVCPYCYVDGVYPSLYQVPTDVSLLSVEDVVQCLVWLNLHKYVDKFRAELIDGALLTSLDQQVLMEDFGFRRIEAIRLERFARHGWKPILDRPSLNQQKQQPVHHFLQHADFNLDV